MTPTPTVGRSRSITALAAAVILSVVTLIGIVPAGAADGPTTDVSVTTATAADGLTLHVTGTDFTNLPNASSGAPNQGVYAALRNPATMPDDAINADTSIVPAVKFIYKAQIVGGNWSTDLTAAAADLDPDADWEVIVWVAHGNITPATLLTTTPVQLTNAQKQALFPGWTPPTTTTTTAAPVTTTTPAQPTTTARGTTPTTPGTDPAGLRCVVETVPSTAGAPSLSWGVKGSFVTYIESSIAKGRIDTGGGVTRNGNLFVWPTGTGSVDASGHGTWTFGGFVHFTGHDDVLNLTLSNLRIQLTGSNHGTLVADIASHDMDGNDVGGDGVTLAELTFSSVSSTGGTATVTLTPAGARAFASYYDAGQTLDPLTVSVSTTGGGTVENCYDAQGNLVSSHPVQGGRTGSGSLPATGSDTDTLLRMAGTLVLFGAAAMLVAARRRRSGDLTA